MKQTLQDKIISYMTPREWVSNVELCNIAWWRFWWHLFQLRKKGYKFEKKGRNPWDKKYVEYFKLIAKSNPLVVTEVTGSKVEEKEYVKENQVREWAFNTLLKKLWIK